MSKWNEETTKVVFRKFRDGEIIALFPDIKERNGLVLSYMHIGQHGMADPMIVNDTELAAPLEYMQLCNELTAIGYDLRIMKRMVRKVH